MPKRKIAEIIICLTAAALLDSGCSIRANEELYGQPYTPDVSRWRQYLGVAIAIQLFFLALALWNSNRHEKMSRMFLSLVLVPLLWTYPAELLYRLQVWVLDWGWPGHLLAIILSFAGGLYGTLSVFSYILGGFIFNDTHYLLYWSVPGVVAGFLLAAWYISGKIRSKKTERSERSAKTHLS